MKFVLCLLSLFLFYIPFLLIYLNSQISGHLMRYVYSLQM
nr:MAG TPA: hypothetical protein [Caudoviricetes sp.]DAN78541.1 MAG TPA: hypothetical protein [Caudoviricetes sp.]DAQ56662.1 MAG TPA: hypothetical protein [Caudoviricetes sp.]